MERKTWTVQRRLVLRAQVRAGQNHSLAGLVQCYQYACALAPRVRGFRDVADRAEAALRAIGGGMAVKLARARFEV